MEQKIFNELEIALKIASEKFKADSVVKDFEQASIEFDKLVEQGLVKKRGYNLLSIEEAHLHRIGFNTAN